MAVNQLCLLVAVLMTKRPIAHPAESQCGRKCENPPASPTYIHLTSLPCLHAPDLLLHGKYLRAVCVRAEQLQPQDFHQGLSGTKRTFKRAGELFLESMICCLQGGRHAFATGSGQQMDEIESRPPGWQLDKGHWSFMLMVTANPEAPEMLLGGWTRT